ncbi:hypothetical protein L1887_51908 [Cichorium endivia]|nr:hypothetical protein L1887_51908 [Cichorium endivia]
MPSVSDMFCRTARARSLDHPRALGPETNASSEGDSADEVVHCNDAAVGGARADADVDDLDAEFVLPVTEAEHVAPQPREPTGAARGRRERVHTNAVAHLLERVAELGVLADLMAVLARELAQRGAEEIELLAELGELRGGEVVAERVVRGGGV